MFPKIAVVCGAHTELGKLVIRELVRAAEVDLVHALAEVDCRDSIHVRPHEAPKLRLHVTSLDYIERALRRSVPDADVAFCCLGSSRKDFSALGAYAFHKLNLDIPRRFVREMFVRGVQRIAVLSHTGADSRSKTEFLRVKGELIDDIAQMLRDAGRFAPTVALFKVPLLLTDGRDQNGVKGTSISTVDRIKQHAALKFDMGPARAVHVRDVAKAMCVDTLTKADVEQESDLAYRFGKHQLNLSELSGLEIVSLAEETRALQKSTLSKLRNERSVAQRVSQFAREEGAMQDLDEHSLDLNAPGGIDSRDASISEGSGSFPGDQQRDSYYFYGSPRPAANHDGEGAGMDGSRVDQIQYVQVPSERSGGFQSARTGSDRLGEDSAPPKPIGSVESLGQQLGRPLTTIKGNDLLPDIERYQTKRRSRVRLLRETFVQDLRHDRRGAVNRPGGTDFGDGMPVDENDEDEFSQGGGSSFRSYKGSANSQTLESPRSGMVDDDSALMSEEYVPLKEFPRRDTSGANRPSGASPEFRNRLQRSRSHHESLMRESHERGYRYVATSGRSRRDMPRGRSESKPVPAMERFSSLVGRVIAATDRPSTRKPRSVERLSHHSGEEIEEQIRGNGDMRAVGKTSI